MIYREAIIEDISQIQIVRNLVGENTLSNPELITNADCEEFLTQRGKGWVCEVNGGVIGFAIADLEKNNIWALFINPDFEGKGIGKKLHDTMMNWYFSNTQKSVWLSTEPKTRAEKFYRKHGWEEVGIYGKGEIKFEMTFDKWTKQKKNSYQLF